eukprot:SAG22_NODE_7295_length_754_cov_1.235115_1_plen_132_part_00
MSREGCSKLTKARRYQPGEAIIAEGETGDCMYIVQAGEAVVVVADVGEVARKRKGDYFGEQALLDDAPRSATITASATEPAGMSCLELSRVTFESFVSSLARLELLLAQVWARLSFADPPSPFRIEYCCLN